MPSCITHQLVAEETKELLPAYISELITRAPDEFYLGAQGPDTFFFYRIGSKKELNVGKFMHRYRVFDTFELFLRILKQDEKDSRIPHFSEEEWVQAFAYILGFVTHYCTDGNFHPFVYKRLERLAAKKIIHQQIESDWDVHFLRALRNRESQDFSFAFSHKKIIEHRTVYRIYACWAQHMERAEIKESKFRGGVNNFHKYLWFFHRKRAYKKQRFWEKAEKVYRKKYLSALFPRERIDESILTNEHFLADSGNRGKHANELFALAVSDSVRLIENFVACIDGNALSKQEFGKSFLTSELV